MNMQILEEVDFLGFNISVYGDDNHPLFLAKDIAEWLGYDSVANITKHIEKKDKHLYDGNVFLTETGLEVAIHWMNHINFNTATAATCFVRQKRMLLREYKDYIKSNFADSDIDSFYKSTKIASTIRNKIIDSDSYTMRYLRDTLVIKKFKITIYELFIWMKTNGFIQSEGPSKNKPTLKSLELNLFRLKKRISTSWGGGYKKSIEVKITKNGVEYFINKFLS